MALGIQPAGWAFAIWSVIYSLLAAFAVYQALPDSVASSRNNDFIFNEIGWLWSINMLVGSTWIPVFQ